MRDVIVDDKRRKRSESDIELSATELAWLIGDRYRALLTLEISQQSAVDRQGIGIGTFDDVDIAR